MVIGGVIIRSETMLMLAQLYTETQQQTDTVVSILMEILTQTPQPIGELYLLQVIVKPTVCHLTQHNGVIRMVTDLEKTKMAITRMNALMKLVPLQ